MVSSVKDYRFSFGNLGINVNMVERALGYGTGSSPEPFPDLIRKVLENCGEIAEAKGTTVKFNSLILYKEGTLELGGVRLGVGRKIIKQLRQAEGAELYLATAGKGIEEYSRRLMAEGDPVEGFIADSVGSLVVEATIEMMQDELQADVAYSGMKMTNRYSPGYCGWALNEQQLLFSLVPAGASGISLSDSFLMNPIKSASGIIGFGRDVKKTVYECQLCELETCAYRELRLERGR